MNYMSACLEVALEEGKYVIGYKQALKTLRGGGAKLVILAKNIPDQMQSEMEKYAAETKTQVICFSGNNFDLGNAIGKFFNVGTVVITDVKVSQDMIHLLADANE
ncbi:60S ribosomal protein L30-like [Drosophila guanche]|uniref:Blast:60S ribosomal protein L30 n=1 Tax=Drosophila guanche TaxID=7266 RepID=A0A3B0K839_DROGU|nr:60S ribosomal protein L30-like [Drosophila guanche]SPP88832.1 blast:60S ribosomal protein L30 [Drosophila guanche]